MPSPAFLSAAVVPSRSLSPQTGSATSALTPRTRVSQPPRRRCTPQTGHSMSVSTVEEKGAGMRLIRAADEATIEKLGCRSWPTWGCPPSEFDWSYDDDEVALVLEGDVTVVPDDGSESMTFVAGDIIFFPKAMSCKWIVRKAVNKHYTFGIRI